MVHQWGFFGSISAIRKIWSLTANSRSLQAAALKSSSISSDNNQQVTYDKNTFHSSCHLSWTQKSSLSPLRIYSGSWMTYGQMILDWTAREYLSSKAMIHLPVTVVA